MVVAATDMLPVALGIYPQHFGIFFRQPVGPGTGGSGKDDLSAVIADTLDGRIQKGEIIFSLPGFQLCPGEDAHRHLIAVCQLHQAHIFIPHGLVVDPLLRIIVRAVNEVGKAITGELAEQLTSFSVCGCTLNPLLCYQSVP